MKKKKERKSSFFSPFSSAKSESVTIEKPLRLFPAFSSYARRGSAVPETSCARASFEDLCFQYFGKDNKRANERE